MQTCSSALFAIFHERKFIACGPLLIAATTEGTGRRAARLDAAAAQCHPYSTYGIYEWEKGRF